MSWMTSWPKSPIWSVCHVWVGGDRGTWQALMEDWEMLALPSILWFTMLFSAPLLPVPTHALSGWVN